MNNNLNAKGHALLRGCLTLALLALALVFGPVLLNPGAQANPGDKGQAQKPGVATPAATGAISGIVTDAATSAPLAGVQVSVWTSNFNVISFTTTDGAGVYTTPANLETGTYFVVTSNSLGYIDELYDDMICVSFGCLIESGTPIAVTSGATTAGVNFALTPGGRISGTVIDAATSAPLANLHVRIYREEGSVVSNVFTDAAGNYTSGTGLPTGTYYASTLNSQGYIDEIYDNIVCLGCNGTFGTPIAVTSGATTAGINFALDVGGRISGRVTDAGTGEPISNAPVIISNSSGDFIDSAITNESGDYVSSTGLPTGSWFVRTFLIGQAYMNELYDNIPCPALGCDLSMGTPVPVTAGATTKGIDFALTAGGIITGTVIDAVTKAPLADVFVELYDSNGEPLISFITDSSGNYSTTNLPDGTYYVSTGNLLGYVDEVYDNITCVPCDVTTGTPITVTAGTTVSNIDFALSAGGRISGSITDAVTGLPIVNINIEVYTAAGELIAVGGTDPDGRYDVNRGLPTGTYFAVTNNLHGYLNELYKETPCFICDVTSGTPISVTEGLTTTDINFTLQRGGRISGTITNSVTSAPVSSLVIIFDSTGNQVASTFTDASGNYLTAAGMPTGTYYVRTSNFDGLFDAIYNNITCFICDATIGSPIPVTNGQTTPSINFALCPSFSLSQSSRFFGASGGEGSFVVTSLGGCGWAAVSDAPWIEITSHPVSTGNGPVTYLVRDNPGPAPRTGTISAANMLFTVTQEGRSAPDCTFEIEPQFQSFDPPGGFGTINVIAPAGCAWRAETASSWITLSAMCCDIGSGSVAYTVAPNLTGIGRSGAITIAGKKFNVKQK